MDLYCHSSYLTSCTQGVHCIMCLSEMLSSKSCTACGAMLDISIYTTIDRDLRTNSIEKLEAGWLLVVENDMSE
jgi:hypothetical protein